MIDKSLKHSEYHPQTSVTEVKHRPLTIVLGRGTQFPQELESMTWSMNIMALVSVIC